MSGGSLLEGYVRELGRELARRGVRDRRVLGEARAHLEDAAAVFGRGGLPRQQAERRAIAAFGTAAEVAAATAADDVRRPSWRMANERNRMNVRPALALGLAVLVAAVAAGALVLGDGDEQATAAPIETAAGLKRLPRLATKVEVRDLLGSPTKVTQFPRATGWDYVRPFETVTELHLRCGPKGRLAWRSWGARGTPPSICRDPERRRATAEYAKKHPEKRISLIPPGCGNA